MAVTANSEGAGLLLYGEKGEQRATLEVERIETKLSLGDSTGRTRAELSALNLGPGLVLYGSEGKPRGIMAVTKERPVIGLYDEKQNAVFSAP